MLESQLARLAAEATRVRPHHLRELLNAPDRVAACSRRHGSLLLDFSRQKLDATALATLGAIAEESQWSAARDAMFRGDVVNASEQRPALHTALRATGAAPLPSASPTPTGSMASMSCGLPRR